MSVSESWGQVGYTTTLPNVPLNRIFLNGATILHGTFSNLNPDQYLNIEGRR